jgi:hypothetical protein
MDLISWNVLRQRKVTARLKPPFASRRPKLQAAGASEALSRSSKPAENVADRLPLPLVNQGLLPAPALAGVIEQSFQSR